MLSGMAPPSSCKKRKRGNEQMENYQEMNREDYNGAEGENQGMNNQEIQIGRAHV